MSAVVWDGGCSGAPLQGQGLRFLAVLSAQCAPAVLTNGGSRVLGTLTGMKDMTVAAAVRSRGGGGAQVHKVATHLQQQLLGDVANLAAKGDGAAKTAIKIVKDAARLARK